MKTHSFIAFDLGAESGRTILGTLENQRIHIKNLSRFSNTMLSLLGHLHWNIFRLFEEMKRGLKTCALETDTHPESLALNTWGVDYALLAPDGSILSLPYAYRDGRTRGAMEEFFKKIPRERIYQLTGIQFLQFNTLFQLFAMSREKSPLLEMATDLLFIPDVFNYLFTGEKKTEFTYATTSQLFNPRKNDWEDELFSQLGISKSIMQEIILPGTNVGSLAGDICGETGLDPLPVIAVASHDTASAIAAVPAEDEDWAYISSGTWSCIGIETNIPIITEKALESNFTNEGGVGGTFRFLKNIMGLWLLQECRRSWVKERLYSYEELTQAAASASPFKALIDPDRQEFLNPPDMPEAIRQFCQKTQQHIPNSHSDFVRCILESLALKYRFVLDQLGQIDVHPVRRIHIIGGGAQNRLLCQFTANATRLPVIAGPVEATALGNIMVQALSTGYVHSFAEIREVIRQSFKFELYKPQHPTEWEAAYRRFLDLI